jgi:transposase InsO family protein
MDLFTRTITGFSVLTNHSVHLVVQCLFSGIHKYPAPEILHSDRGSEYTSKDMCILLDLLGVWQSMSRAGCPWENGYQESFYAQFKVDLGDPGRFSSLGELVYEIYRLLFVYNTSRIHTALKMPPQTFTLRYATTEFLAANNVS